MKKFLLLAVSLMLIGAGCMAQPAPTPSPAPAPAPAPAPTPSPAPAPGPTGATPIKGGTETVTDQVMKGNVSVNVTPGGTFDPATVVISAGSTVTWTNNSDTPVWIASNPHPTHTDYPGFDSKMTIDQGKTYSFTFDKVGSWGYHNHMSPAVMGTVIVQQ